MTKRTKDVEKPKEPIASQYNYKPTPKAKEEKSKFDKLLEQKQFKQSSTVQDSSLFRKTATDQAVGQARSQDQGEREKRDEKKEFQKKEGDERSSEKRSESGQKIVAKSSLKGQKEHGGSQNKQGGKGFGMSRRGLVEKKSLQQKGKSDATVVAKGKFARELAQSLKELSSTRAKSVDQEVLNEIVKYVKIAKNDNDEKEMEIHFRDKLFKGLKLKVASKGKGRVSVHFSSSDSETRRIFDSNKKRIVDALGKQGIEVDEISVS